MFQAMVEGVQDYAIAMLDLKGRVVSWNEGARRITGYAGDEIVGREFSVFYPYEAANDGTPQRLLEAARKRRRCEYEGWQLRKDGTSFWANVVLAVRRDAFGAVVGFSSLTRDLTERRLAERAARIAAEELKRRDERLRHAQKLEAVGALAGGVAHEFNNLLQAIQAFTKFAMEGLTEGDPRRGDLQQSLAAADRAAALTRKLLGFSRRQTLELERVHPNRLIEQFVEMVRPLIGAHIDVDVRLGEGIGTICVDVDQFHQMLLNLCLNARDAMPEGGTLRIQTESLRAGDRFSDALSEAPPGDYLVVVVSDTGVGMSPEVRERIFEPFFTTKPVGEGTGLGLPMVYGVVRQHHGRIQVDSEVGRGATFKIFLPIVDGGLDPADAEEAPSSLGGDETILAADDEPHVLESCRRILTRAGYRVLVARDGREAWDTFWNHKDEVDLLLLDVMMPHVSGRELRRRLQARGFNPPVLFCSGFDPASLPGREEDVDAPPLLLKPFSPELLLSAVRRVLNRREVQVS
jgi:PAS domain S-box-containing protein